MFKRETDTCLLCGGVVDLWAERQYSQGKFIARIVGDFKCRRGCRGAGVLDPDAPPVIVQEGGVVTGRGANAR
jgi:hypothetical protein